MRVSSFAPLPEKPSIPTAVSTFSARRRPRLEAPRCRGRLRRRTLSRKLSLRSVREARVASAAVCAGGSARARRRRGGGGTDSSVNHGERKTRKHFDGSPASFPLLPCGDASPEPVSAAYGLPGTRRDTTPFLTPPKEGIFIFVFLSFSWRLLGSSLLMALFPPALAAIRRGKWRRCWECKQQCNLAVSARRRLSARGMRGGRATLSRPSGLRQPDSIVSCPRCPAKGLLWSGAWVAKRFRNSLLVLADGSEIASSAPSTIRFIKNTKDDCGCGEKARLNVENDLQSGKNTFTRISLHLRLDWMFLEVVCCDLVNERAESTERLSPSVCRPSRSFGFTPVPTGETAHSRVAEGHGSASISSSSLGRDDLTPPSARRSASKQPETPAILATRTRKQGDWVKRPCRPSLFLCPLLPLPVTPTIFLSSPFPFPSSGDLPFFSFSHLVPYHSSSPYFFSLPLLPHVSLPLFSPLPTPSSPTPANFPCPPTLPPPRPHCLLPRAVTTPNTSASVDTTNHLTAPGLGGFSARLSCFLLVVLHLRRLCSWPECVCLCNSAGAISSRLARYSNIIS
ncbi:hypothetical protein C7M84_010019 [Penaeus vannamei]|uniref:Uncharacterized protein n=1 Tax=Penaeus vannamei TaxID=6689 RepID=A0A423T587_PENVA|nr:hypothetical protein C7M84_010019 [Penaeus vannamei]